MHKSGFVSTALRARVPLPTLRSAAVFLGLVVPWAHARPSPAPARPSFPQSATCNDTSRTIQVTAGYHNSMDESRQTLSISVAGVTFSSPGSGIVGYSFYAGSVYSCGPSATNVNCNPNGYKVTVKLASGGGCPDITGLVGGGSYGSWAEVPTTLAEAMRCRAPTVTETFDWSAKVSACQVVPPPPPLLEPGLDGDGYPYVAVLGDPRPLAGSEPWSLLATPYVLSKQPTSAILVPELSAVLAAHSPLTGGLVSAESTLESGVNGVVQATQTHWIQGRVSSTGHMDLTSTTVVDKDGERQRLTERVAFDGTSLILDPLDGEAGLVYGSSYPRLKETEDLIAHESRLLFDWLVDPFLLPAFEGVQVEWSPEDPAGLHTLQRMVPVGAAGVALERWTVDSAGGLLHPVRLELFDALGRLRFDARYSQYQLVGESSWRPFRTETTRYLDGTPEGRFQTSELVIRAASLLTAEQAQAQDPISADRPFLVWQ